MQIDNGILQSIRENLVGQMIKYCPTCHSGNVRVEGQRFQCGDCGLDIDSKIYCPVCGGRDLVIHGEKGRCRECEKKYKKPKARPLPTKCPICNSTDLASNQNRLKCRKCGYTNEI